MGDKERYEEQVESGIVKSHEERVAESEFDVARHEKLLSLSEREIKALKKDIELVTANPKKLNPDFEFQKLDDYWVTQNELRMINYEKQMIEKDAQLDGLKKVIGIKKEELERLKGE